MNLTGLPDEDPEVKKGAGKNPCHKGVRGTRVVQIARQVFVLDAIAAVSGLAANIQELLQEAVCQVYQWFNW